MAGRGGSERLEGAAGTRLGFVRTTGDATLSGGGRSDGGDGGGGGGSETDMRMTRGYLQLLDPEPWIEEDPSRSAS